MLEAIKHYARWGCQNDTLAPLAVVIVLLLSPWLMALGLGD